METGSTTTDGRGTETGVGVRSFKLDDDVVAFVDHERDRLRIQVIRSKLTPDDRVRFDALMTIASEAATDDDRRAARDVIRTDPRPYSHYLQTALERASRTGTIHGVSIDRTVNDLLRRLMRAERSRTRKRDRDPDPGVQGAG